MVDNSVEAKQTLDEFFGHLKDLRKLYEHYTSEVPTKLIINPDIVGQMAKVEGFYQREELGGIVSAYAPVIRYFKINDIVVTIVDDWEEKFLHFE